MRTSTNTPADLIDELINAAQRVGCGDGTVSRVVALRAEVLALVIGDDPTRDAAIALCRKMAAWIRRGQGGASPEKSADERARILASAASRQCVASEPAAVWIIAADLLAKGWRP